MTSYRRPAVNRVLVTGGAGYVGTHVVNLLRERCIVYDALLYTNEYLKPGPFVYGDVTEDVRLKPLLSEVDCVVWLAAIVGDAACMVNPRKAIATNQEAVQFLAENFDGPIIFPSSCSVYGINEGMAASTPSWLRCLCTRRRKSRAKSTWRGRKLWCCDWERYTAFRSACASIWW